jgi:hypothetical protein
MRHELCSDHCSAKYRDGFQKHLVVYTKLQFKQKQRRRRHSKLARSAVASKGLLSYIRCNVRKKDPIIPRTRKRIQKNSQVLNYTQRPTQICSFDPHIQTRNFAFVEVNFRSLTNRNKTQAIIKTTSHASHSSTVQCQ